MEAVLPYEYLISHVLPSAEGNRVMRLLRALLLLLHFHSSLCHISRLREIGIDRQSLRIIISLWP